MILTKDKKGEAARDLLGSIRETPVLELTEEAKGIIEKHYGKHSFMLNHRLFGKFEQSLPYSHSSELPNPYGLSFSFHQEILASFREV